VRRIANSCIQASVHLPDPVRGFYRGTRFDWSGMVAQVECRGHTFFSELKHPHDPTIHDHGCGPAEEFGIAAPLGFDAAREGETFVKIGVGCLEKEGKSYQFAKPYRLVGPGQWTVTAGRDWMCFDQVLADARGWGYAYRKRLSLQAAAPVLLVEHTLRNTGDHAIETDHYSHNFIAIDGHPVGRDYRIEFPFAPSGENTRPDVARVEGRSLVFLPPALHGSFWMKLNGFSRPEHSAFVVRHAPSGIAVRGTLDAPLSACVAYAEKTAACPELFAAIRLKPRAEFSWASRYEFITE
jgi:hypothetical protein